MLPVRNWISPASSWVSPPNISATPNTAGSTPLATKSALTMLSMNVVTANAASASGAELPHSIGLAAAAGVAPLCSGVGAIRRSCGWWWPWSSPLTVGLRAKAQDVGDVTCERSARAVRAMRWGWSAPAASLDPFGDRGPRGRARHRGADGSQKGNPAACGGFAATHPSQGHVEPAGRPISPPARGSRPANTRRAALHRSPPDAVEVGLAVANATLADLARDRVPSIRPRARRTLPPPGATSPRACSLTLRRSRSPRPPRGPALRSRARAT